MELTHSDVQNILAIIDKAEHLDEIEVVYGGFRLHVVRNGAGGGKPLTVPAAGAAPEKSVVTAPAAVIPAPRAAEVTVPEGVVAIRAPMLGIFYRASGPGERLRSSKRGNACGRTIPSA